MRDALLGVILEFSALMLVSAAAGMVLGWVIGSRRRSVESPTTVAPGQLAETREQPAVAQDLAAAWSPAESVRADADVTSEAPAGPVAVMDAAGASEEATDATASTEDPAGAGSDAETLRREITELRSELDHKDRELMRLETGATAAWDTTVPDLQHRIDELRADNERLTTELRQARSQLEGFHSELDRARSSQSRSILPEDAAEGGA